MRYYTPALLTLLLLFSITSLASFVLTRQLTDATSQALAKRTASVLLNSINLARVAYSQKVTSVVNKEGHIRVGFDYHGDSLAIPNPATFTIELAEAISQVDQELSVRMYSDYPFPNRASSGGVHDEFERRALNTLISQPELPVVVTERGEKGEVLRYAEAMVMVESCVECHNSMVGSPKKDWVVGDVRGAMSVTVPLSEQSVESVRRSIYYMNLVSCVLLLVGVMTFVIIWLRSHRLDSELEEQVVDRTQVLLELANTDALTGVGNRRYFETQLELALSCVIQQQGSLALLILDLDYFKKINDRHGHSVGDLCLQEAAKVVNACLRSDNLLARIGGEEFSVLLADVDLSGAIGVAERIRQVIAECDVGGVNFTISIGVSFCPAGQRMTGKALTEQADQALYMAKEQGRDRVVAYSV